MSLVKEEAKEDSEEALEAAIKVASEAMARAASEAMGKAASEAMAKVDSVDTRVDLVDTKVDLADIREDLEVVLEAVKEDSTMVKSYLCLNMYGLISTKHSKNVLLLAIYICTCTNISLFYLASQYFLCRL